MYISVVGADRVPVDSGVDRAMFGYFGSKLAAKGAGRIEGVRDGRAVESWFFPAARDDPFAYIHVRDEPAPGAPSGARVTVPLAADRLPADGRLRTLVSQLVQLRPVLEDPERELWLELPSAQSRSCARPSPSPTPSGRCCSTTRSRSHGACARG